MKRQMPLACVLVALCIYCAGSRAAMPGVTVQSVKGDYEDVKERVIEAVENRGLVVDHTSRVGRHARAHRQGHRARPPHLS
jgi:hypothetical protein